MVDVSDNKIPLTRIQKLIGRLMLKSKQQGAYSYLESRADVTELVKIRKPYCKSVGIRVTTNDFFLCAMARAVGQLPLMAGRLDEDDLDVQISETVGVGFAVAAPQGLVVPVIHDTAEMPLPKIAAESDALLKKARANKLMPDDFAGAAVILSGLGMYGISSFFAIAPPGATAIVSIGIVEERIVPIDGNMKTRKTMSVALAANRRILTDPYAAKYLNAVIKQIENPADLTQ